MKLTDLPDGWTIKVAHRSSHNFWMPDAAAVTPRGRLLLDGQPRFVTVATILDTDGGFQARGFAMCRPEDKFDWELGRTIALGRALASLEGERGPRSGR